MTENSIRDKRRPNWAALIISVALLGISALILWEATKLSGAARYARIGPSTFAYVIGAMLGGLGLWTLYTAFRGSFPRWEVPELGPVIWVSAGMIAQMLMLPHAGFSVATGILFGMTARGFGRKPLWLTVAVGIPFAFLIWIVFARLLMLSLPAGPLERLIP